MPYFNIMKDDSESSFIKDHCFFFIILNFILLYITGQNVYYFQFFYRGHIFSNNLPVFLFFRFVFHKDIWWFYFEVVFFSRTWYFSLPFLSIFSRQFHHFVFVYSFFMNTILTLPISSFQKYFLFIFLCLIFVCLSWICRLLLPPQWSTALS